MSQGTSKDYEASIVRYYDESAIDYRMLWRLDRCMALHFGYWDETTKGVSDALLRENQILAERAVITDQDTVLDAGCGHAELSLALAAQGYTVVGIDVSPTAIAAAATSGIPSPQ